MGQTLVEKVLSEKMGRPVHAGETIVVDVDFAALHDGSGPLLVRLKKGGIRRIRYLMQIRFCLPMNLARFLPGRWPTSTH